MSAVSADHPCPGVARIVIDAPPANALGRAVREDVTRELDRIEADLDVRAAILTGRGRIFCTGDDLMEAVARDRAAAVESLEDFSRLFERLARLRVPVVAAVNGWCTGGGLELALCCDLRIASDQARFVCAGVNVGLVASAWRLPRLIGLSRAKQMLLTGSPVTAAEAERFGLVSEVVAAEALDGAALALAERIASRAPLAAEAAKRCANQAFELDAEAGAALFRREAAALAETEDHAAALAAFTEKRQPTFRRR
jgi:enoyl-CoA hydratase/carnithine racemase